MILLVLAPLLQGPRGNRWRRIIGAVAVFVPLGIDHLDELRDLHLADAPVKLSAFVRLHQVTATPAEKLGEGFILGAAHRIPSGSLVARRMKR